VISDFPFTAPQEVAGTSVYDERRAQSIGILEETRNKVT
jgi:hypothetical protein